MKFYQFIFSRKAYPAMIHTWLNTAVMIAAIILGIRQGLALWVTLLLVFFCISSISASWVQAFMRFSRFRG